MKLLFQHLLGKLSRYGHIAEGTPVIVKCGEDQRFKITPEQLEAAITPNTRLVVLNSPSNNRHDL